MSQCSVKQYAWPNVRHLQRLGHIVVDDALREALDDGGLADARLANEARVVLRPPRQDLDRPPDLVVPPDHLPCAAVPLSFGRTDLCRIKKGVE